MMNTLERDNSKTPREDIIKNPGTIAAQIVYNILCDNDFELYYIGGIMGNVLYTVQLSNTEKALVAFTSTDLLITYVNKRQMKPKIRKSFGKKLACVKISIDTVNSLIRQTALKASVELGVDPVVLDIVIINPNMRDKFVPISISHTTSLLGHTYQEDNQYDLDTVKISMEDVDVLQYDKESGDYLFIEEDEGMIG